MITLYDFIGMDDNQKAEVTWTGTHLGERIEADEIVQLYSLPGFYVEVFYALYSNEIVRFRPFTKLHLLTPYIQL